MSSENRSHFSASCSSVTEEARAKINLALHVTGQRPDGYHLLDMLVTFADYGDRLGFMRSPADAFTLSGRFGGTLAGDGIANLVLKARDLLRETVGPLAFPVHIHLEKNLPIASGIGGRDTARADAALGRDAAQGDARRTCVETRRRRADVP